MTELSNNTNIGDVYVALFLAGLVVLSVIFDFLMYVFFSQTRKINVVEKFTYYSNKVEHFIVVDENGINYRVYSPPYRFSFDTTELYSSMKTGNTYNVTFYGKRIKFLSLYPTIYCIDNTKDKTV